MYRNRNTNYFSRLAVQDKRVFRSSELALLWDLSNKNTLHTTLARYQKRGLLHRLSFGVYSILPICKLNIYEIGCAVFGPLSYISGETVLFNKGLINQPVFSLTLMGKKSKEFTINGQKYLCRYLHPRYLVNRAGVISKKGYAIATLLRAVADLKYIQPNYHLDNKLNIGKKDLIKMNKEVGYK